MNVVTTVYFVMLFKCEFWNLNLTMNIITV